MQQRKVEQSFKRQYYEIIDAKDMIKEELSVGTVIFNMKSTMQLRNFQGTMHGGCIFASIDSLVCTAVYSFDQRPVNVIKQDVEYINAVPLEVELQVKVLVRKISKNFAFVETVIINDNKAPHRILCRGSTVLEFEQKAKL
ncbi:UNKNOWN [Stylonychia lemnae]|uniref:Thioesterase domain-containing protein n=1 Tax=Stylonychia lemnae TaxID=5949 RepID=A0A078AQT4_STYLE|nr:UNKNOWN [Stylonychia lemnae]|eukprot:CDW84790.1 UNKNOWN [Stylonychia lemnae]